MNYHKGFIASLLLALIALLLIGGGAYVYTQRNQINQPAVTTSNTQTTSTTQTTNSNSGTTDASDVPVILTTSDICSPVIEDSSTLLFTDKENKTWTVNYLNASFSEYSGTTGTVQHTNGLLDSTLQGWLKSLRHTGQSPTEICGAPGSITITGKLNASGIVVASSIKVTGQ